MHAPFQETSPTLIVDLVNKFLSKLLSNDPNSSTYLKQWNSFRELLSAAPFDLNPIFSFIGCLNSQPNQSGEYSISNKLYLPSSADVPKEESCYDSGDSMNRGENSSLRIEANKFPSHKRVTSNTLNFPHLSSTGMHLRKAASINKLLPSPFKPSLDNLDSVLNQKFFPSATKGPSPGEGSLAGIDSATAPASGFELREEEQAGLNYLRSEGHSLAFLAEMARKMKNKLRRHNENLAQRHVVIPESTPSPDWRTPLKDLRMYNTKPSPIDTMNIYGAVKTNGDADTRSATPCTEDDNARKLIYNVQNLPLY